MKTEFILWYQETKNILDCILPDKGTSNVLLHFELFHGLRNSFEGKKDAEDNQYLQGMIVALFWHLDVSSDLNLSLWEDFSLNSFDCVEFQEKYRVQAGWRLEKGGTFWLNYIEALDQHTIEEKVNVMGKLMDACNWLTEYCTVFAYQYHLRHPSNLKFAIKKLNLLQYWDYKEVEESFHKLEGLNLNAKIDELSQLYAADSFDNTYPDRETLLLDFVTRGIPIVEALKMVYCIRCGRGNKLSTQMDELLVCGGYSEDEIQKLKGITYLKSKSKVIRDLLFTEKLI